MNKTHMDKTKDIKSDWHLYDLSDKILGRAASDIAQLLIGKHKPTYTPHIDNGDTVVAVNAEKIKVTGRKKTDKEYHRHSGYPGGYRKETLEEKMEKDPTKVIELAVKGMLPKNKLRTPRMRRLKVYAGQEHPHESQLKEGDK